jgi:hypothetical protein
MAYWVFDENRCAFVLIDKWSVQDSDMPVVFNNGDDVFVRLSTEEHRWPSGERLVVAGVEFEREFFE